MPRYGFKIYCTDAAHTETIKTLFSPLNSYPKIVPAEDHEPNPCLSHNGSEAIVGYVCHDATHLGQALNTCLLSKNNAIALDKPSLKMP